jgi:hypothetical protein
MTALFYTLLIEFLTPPPLTLLQVEAAEDEEASIPEAAIVSGRIKNGDEPVTPQYADEASHPEIHVAAPDAHKAKEGQKKGRFTVRDLPNQASGEAQVRFSPRRIAAFISRTHSALAFISCRARSSIHVLSDCG